MGSEAGCVLRQGRARLSGRALLETDHLLFRGGDQRVKVMFSALTGVAARGGVLQLTTGETAYVFELEAAERWADKIRNPRSLLDKLGVKPGMRVAVLGVTDAAFDALLRDRVSDVTTTRPKRESDIVFLGVESEKGLARLTALRGTLKPNGAIWVVHRKGKDAKLRDVDVFAAARAAGLVDNKVAAFSATHTAERLVIPLAQRKAPAPARIG